MLKILEILAVFTVLGISLILYCCVKVGAKADQKIIGFFRKEKQ